MWRTPSENFDSHGGSANCRLATAGIHLYESAERQPVGCASTHLHTAVVQSYSRLTRYRTVTRTSRWTLHSTVVLIATIATVLGEICCVRHTDQIPESCNVPYLLHNGIVHGVSAPCHFELASIMRRHPYYEISCLRHFGGDAISESNESTMIQEMTIDRQRSSTFLRYMLLHDVGEDYWLISYYFFIMSIFLATTWIWRGTIGQYYGTFLSRRNCSI